ncbi:DDE_3 domain-containing protein [Trichonephila clavipes]|nr:DDE_3 domain-containing protein [Trichonephila clavipes]
MDDNARPHRARIVEEYLEDHGLERMEWPARSPDLNPIEHLWNYLGREVAALNPPPRSLHELKQGLLCVWSSLPIPVSDNLINSMGNRCRQCIQHYAVHAHTCTPKIFRGPSSDIAPTTDGRAKTTLPASRDPGCNSRCRERPPPSQDTGEGVRFETLERMVVFASSLPNNILCRMEIVNSLNNLAARTQIPTVPQNYIVAIGIYLNGAALKSDAKSAMVKIPNLNPTENFKVPGLDLSSSPNPVKQINHREFQLN